MHILVLPLLLPLLQQEVEFLMYDRDLKGEIGVEQTLQILFVRFGRELLDEEIQAIFGEEDRKHEGPEKRVTLTEYLEREEGYYVPKDEKKKLDVTTRLPQDDSYVTTAQDPSRPQLSTSLCIFICPTTRRLGILLVGSSDSISMQMEGADGAFLVIRRLLHLKKDKTLGGKPVPRCLQYRESRAYCGGPRYNGGGKYTWFSRFSRGLRAA
ncbi:EF hand domain-containing protein [Cyclospora cayetanensis]|uniref:EF hand domain-containing protein n=1 Tax=Cyclospora cayetanensis TaxID=88456 RepID=A0A1D3D0F5_9EIME|nr:EF hand domain-containing protein [Cyclospora cayetanensis]